MTFTEWRKANYPAVISEVEIGLMRKAWFAAKGITILERQEDIRAEFDKWWHAYQIEGLKAENGDLAERIWIASWRTALRSEIG